MNTDSSEIASRMKLALTIAREAGKITLEYFRHDDLEVERKGDNTPVTIADRRAEEHLRTRIADAFPSDAVIGEEMSDRPGNSDFRWYIDPIDGTKSFIHGVPLYGNLIGLEQCGEPVGGVIHIPALDESVYATRGEGAWYVQGEQPPRPARVSKNAPLNQSLFVTTEIRTFDEAGRRDVYNRLQSASRLSRSWGDCYGYLMVATGRAEVMVDPIASVWDLAPLLTIIEEAGGRFTDWQGRRSIHSGQGVATNGVLHDEVMAFISQNGSHED
jgi:histidinol phosphatase-like enzyme (inositol monophosphatase family)